MTLSPEIVNNFPDLNDDQKAIIGHSEGPLLAIAGPGSGKTYCIVLRALNLLLLGKSDPKGILLCTFTEKAAFEMRDRIAAAARKVNYQGDLSELSVNTIHGWCNRILTRHRNRTDLGHNFETLDELTQLLFIFERFKGIIGEPENDIYLNKWKTRWSAIEGVTAYFNKITEELIDPRTLIQSDNPFISRIGNAYVSYRDALAEANRLDFGLMQRLVVDLLEDPQISMRIIEPIRYVMVDEYQDTNFIQEKLLFKITEKTRNLCVVGDEDQSLYRFRGATVRNILEFPVRQEGCQIVTLDTNYRSHGRIIDKYDNWMASIDWSNPDGPDFRFDKTIKPDPNAAPIEYPSVFSVWGQNSADEANRIADMVAFLKENGVIEDFSQVALLLHSVRLDHSGPYFEAFFRRGIPVFCPRARAFFENDEIKRIVACFALLFNWTEEARGETFGAVAELAEYVDDAIVQLARNFGGNHLLAKTIRIWREEIDSLEEDSSLDVRPADYFYRLIAIDPFKDEMKREESARNLAVFSQLLNIFQNYYHINVVTHRNREAIPRLLFNSFLRLLHDGGINEYEDPDRPFPKGYVQLMTIHQAKGLEFPVVIVGSLSVKLSTAKKVDHDLGPFYSRPPFEPEKRITLFDRMRLHYVAFSRPQNLLVLTAHEEPKQHFTDIWEGLDQWPYVQKELLAIQRFKARERMPIKRTFSFTGDLKVYETCPRQYQYFREYDFTPSRSAVIFFGLLVHQTIEEIHRFALDGWLDELREEGIRWFFDRTFRFLSMSDVRPIGDAAREAAFSQVMYYFNQNRDEMRRIIQTEVDVSLEKEGYILAGKVDLLLGGDGKMDLLDFKTSPRPENSPELIEAYERQLCTYAHILEKRYGKRVDRLSLYWTSEPDKKKALMTLPFNKERVEEAGRHFDEVVERIKAHRFEIEARPEPRICKECDIRLLCAAEGDVPGGVFSPVMGSRRMARRKK